MLIDDILRANNGSYVGATKAELIKIEPTLSSASFAAEPTVSATGYEITINGSTGQTFTVKNAAGTMSFPCTVGGKGGCPDDATPGGTGNWG